MSANRQVHGNMASLANSNSLQKDTEGVEVEKVASVDAGHEHVPRDVDAGLTEDEKKIVKRAT